MTRTARKPEPQGWPKLPDCQCGQPAFLICVGADPIREQLLGSEFLTQAGIADAVFCLSCAYMTGWPNLSSEKTSIKGLQPKQ